MECSKNDRWAIQEILYLAECEHFLFIHLELFKGKPFTFVKVGTYFKGHAEDAAAALRQQLGYPDHVVPMDVYEDFRAIGVHVFRRKLENSDISGLFIKHPIAGKCILINYSEDVYRQRFTAAHETAHSIFDDEEDFVVSFKKWDRKDLVEVRANTFASRYLMPPKFLKGMPKPSMWDEEKATTWANKLKVSTEALANALSDLHLIDSQTAETIRRSRVPKDTKRDPELPDSLSPLQRERKQTLLERGLSTHYVNRCFEAYHRGIISAGRMAEMLLVNETEVYEIAALFGEAIEHAG
jgi:Zn-dependent peptidase ImmA (M78 family)